MHWLQQSILLLPTMDIENPGIHSTYRSLTSSNLTSTYLGRTSSLLNVIISLCYCFANDTAGCFSNANWLHSRASVKGNKATRDNADNPLGPTKLEQIHFATAAKASHRSLEIDLNDEQRCFHAAVMSRPIWFCSTICF